MKVLYSVGGAACTNPTWRVLPHSMNLYIYIFVSIVRRFSVECSLATRKRKVGRIKVRGYTLSARLGRKSVSLFLDFTSSFGYCGANQVELANERLILQSH